MLDYFSISGRGPVAKGNIMTGVIAVGMILNTGSKPEDLTVAGVEYIDDVSTGEYWIGILFKENPDIEFLREIYPPGSTMCMQTAS